MGFGWSPTTRVNIRAKSDLEYGNGCVCVCVTCTRVSEHGPCRGSVAVDDYDHLYQQPIF